MAKNQYTTGTNVRVNVADGLHPHGAGLALSGDPILLGSAMPAVMLTDEDADGDATIDTANQYKFAVKGEEAAGDEAIIVGNPVFMDTDAELNADSTNGIFFGYALAPVASGATTTIPVKIGR